MDEIEIIYQKYKFTTIKMKIKIVRKIQSIVWLFCLHLTNVIFCVIIHFSYLYTLFYRNCKTIPS